MDQTQTPSEHPKLDALIAGYLEAVERGEAPDRGQIIAENPDLATELRAFFDDLDRVQRAAASPNDGPAPNKPDAAHASTVIRSNNEPTPGVIIAGRYKLLENIGEGGMGSVWVAEQLKPVKRKVAIKLIKPGMDSKQVLARFEAERQALAVMDHPNIAKVFDGGLTEQGRPYFVMEYVKGVPFTDYCDRARLPLKDRLTLFIAVCSAVQHAHQKGIVHRDLKPSNILICLYDGHPVPKVIDFGLAKAMHQPLTEQSIFTGHGVMVGTPLYMSPEQAESNNLDIDTRTDIYSLGVVLYELLTGSTPLERQQLQKAAFDEVRRLIKEVEPPRPSLRLSGSESLASIAAQRSIDPKQLSRSLAGDLDWIVMKTLDKERSRRYETANGLARDIERFLNEEPVEACPPSKAYRVRKFIKRYKPQVIAATIVFLALVAGIIGTTWGLRKARIAEEKASESEAKTSDALVQVTQERDAKEEEKKKVESARNAERQQRDKAERHLVSSLLRPIGADASEKINLAELKSLAEWAALGDSRLQLLALEALFDEPDLVSRVANRCEHVTQAVVGLSPERYNKAVTLIGQKQRDKSADARVRVAACWIALSLGSPDLPALEESISYLCDPKRRLESRIVKFINLAVRSNDPRILDVVSSRGLDVLLGEMQIQVKHYERYEAPDGMDNGFKTLGYVMQALQLLTPHAAPERVARAWTILISAVCDNDAFLYSNYMGLDELGSTLMELAPRLTQAQAESGWIALVNEISTSVNLMDESVVVDAMVALASRQTAEQITSGVDSLVTLLEKTKGGSRSSAVLSGIMSQSLLEHLSDAQVSRIVNLLTGPFDTLSTEFVSKAGVTLFALGPRVSKQQADESWDKLIEKTYKTNEDLGAIRDMLISIAPYISIEQAHRAGESLVTLSQRADSDRARQVAYSSLTAIASRLTSDQVNQWWDLLVPALVSSEGIITNSDVAQAISALSPHLSQDRVPVAWDSVIAMSERQIPSFMEYYLREAFMTLAMRLSPEQASHSWTALTERISHDPSRCQGVVAIAMCALAPRIDDPNVAGNCLISFLSKTNRSQAVAGGVCRVIGDIAPRLSPEQISSAFQVLLILFTENAGGEDTVDVGTALHPLVRRMNSDQIGRSFEKAISILQQTSEWGVAINPLFLIGELYPHLDADQRLIAGETLANTLSRFDRLPSTIHGQLFAETALSLSSETRDRIATTALMNLLDRKASSSEFLREDDSDIQSRQFILYILAMSNPRSLAKLMSHPACVGRTCDLMLMRFDELVLHDGHAMFLKPEVDAEVEQKKLPIEVRIPDRKIFYTHDASNWIQANWPDFDLEYQHPVTWRAGK